MFGLHECSFGFLLVASSAKGIVSILIGPAPHRLVEDLEESFPDARLVREDRDCQDLLAILIGYLEKPVRQLHLKLDLRGTEFQRRVWEAVRKIPLGKTSTYSEIALEIGAPKAVRAVGSACRKSPMAIAIPCHRVLHKDGSPPGGNFWGLDRHKILLEREAKAAGSG